LTVAFKDRAYGGVPKASDIAKQPGPELAQRYKQAMAAEGISERKIDAVVDRVSRYRSDLRYDRGKYDLGDDESISKAHDLVGRIQDVSPDRFKGMQHLADAIPGYHAAIGYKGRPPEDQGGGAQA
jgi:hypothetical protein